MKGAEPMVDARYLLDDDMMRDFIVTGTTSSSRSIRRLYMKRFMKKQRLLSRRTETQVIIFCLAFPKFKKYMIIRLL